MQDQQTAIIQQYIQAYNQFDIAGMLQNLHPDIHFQNVNNGQLDLETKGIAAFKVQAEKATQYFKARQQKIAHWTFREDTVVVEIDYEGILAIDLPNGMKAGERLQLKGRSEFTFAAMKIIQLRDVV
ncbi:MAG: nuclear transport factor 2 family protein [Bacteroidota bacterium]